MAKQRLLILGANGKLGRMVLRALRAGVCPDVAALGVSRDGSSDIRWAPGQDTVDLPQADCIAALWGVIPSPGADLSLNTDLAQAAKQVAAATGARRVLHCSSVAVYGPQGSPFSETAPLNGASPYAKAKIEMEHVAQGPGQTMLRIGSVVGAESLGAAMKQGTVQLDRFEDGTTPRRSYIAPGDVARAIAALAKLTDPPPVMNLGAPIPVEMDALARAGGITPSYKPAPPGAIADAVLNPSLMTAALGEVCRATTPEAMIADWRRWDEAAP